MIRTLDRLDERYAARLRSRPELAFLLVGVVFAAGTGVHAARYEPAPPSAPPEALAPTAPPGADASGSVLVGPGPDADVDRYVQTRFAELLSLAADEPGTRAAAIVSLDDYRTPADAARLLEAVDVDVYAVRYRLRAPGSDETDEEGASLTRGQVGVTGDLVGTVVAALERTAQEARAQAGELERMAATTDDPEFAETFRRDRDALLAAAASAGAGCACVYAVLLEAAYADLAELASRAGVRLVDPAPPGSDPGRVIFLGIPPER